MSNISDTKPPVFESLSLSKDSIDVSSSDQTVTVTARITDDLSGISNTSSSSGFAQVGLRSPSGDQSIWAWFSEDNRISGDSTDGVYEREITIPAFSEAGEWKVHSIETRDTVGNSDYQNVDNVDGNIPVNLQLALSVLSNISDTKPPVFESLSLSKDSIDVSSSDQTVTFTARITDDLSGISNTSSSSGFAQVGLRSPSGDQSIWAWFSEDNRISGDSTDGVYEREITIPAFSEAGEWKVHSIETRDTVGNSDYQNVDNVDGNIPANLQLAIDVLSDVDNDAPERIAGALNDVTAEEDAGLVSLNLEGLEYSPGPNENDQELSYTITTTPDPSIGSIGYLDGDNNFTIVRAGQSSRLTSSVGFISKPRKTVTDKLTFLSVSLTTVPLGLPIFIGISLISQKLLRQRRKLCKISMLMESLVSMSNPSFTTPRESIKVITNLTVGFTRLPTAC